MSCPESHLEKRLPGALAMLETWVSTNSYSLYADGVERHAKQVIEALTPLGFSPARADAENPNCAPHLFLYRGHEPEKNQVPSIAMVSHLDTVFPESEEIANNFRWKQVDDRIYGPGIWDIKGGSLMIVLLLELMERFQPELFNRVDWRLGFNSSEEILNPSFGRHCGQLFSPHTRAVLIFEGDGVEEHAGSYRFIRQRHGRFCFRISVSGQGAHAGADHGAGSNAIRHLGRMIEPIEALTDYTTGLTVNIGKIQGGVSVNRVPHHAELELEMRAPEARLLENAAAAVRRIVENTPGVTSPVNGVTTQATLEHTQQVPVFERNDATDGLVENFIAAGRDIGCQVSAQSRGGVGDLNYIGMKLPAIDGLGPIGGSAHASEWTDRPPVKRPEFIYPGSIIPKTLLNYHALLRLLK